ncbi:MAG: hypothetical protein LKJ88_07680 [Bacilli bacterium]|jgi:hypothetical protein|nr:hypothetical protein [Bacilli bacterium]
MKITKHLVLLILESLLYILFSVITVTALGSFNNFLGSTDSVLKRMLPFYLSVISLFYLLIVLHLIIFPKDSQKLKLTYKINGIILAGLSFFAVLMTIINLIDKTYASLVSGVLSSLFPLDYLLLDLAILGASIYLTLTGFRYKEDPQQVYYPFQGGKVKKVFSSFFLGLFFLLSSYLTGAFLSEIFIANYGSSTWFNMFILWLLLGVPGFFFFYHEWFFMPKAFLNKEAKKKVSLILLIIGCVLSLSFIIALLVKPNFIVEDATALFPIDYMKSWNLAPYLLSLMAILPPFCFFLTTLKKEEKK